MFLKSTWAFECIRTQTIPVFEIHAHPFISWEKLFQGGYSACGTDTDTHGIQTRKCQLAIVNTESMSSLPPPKVQDLTNSPKRTLHGNRNGKRIYRPYDGDKDSQDRETSVPLFSPNKVVNPIFCLLSPARICLCEKRNTSWRWKKSR